MAFYNDKWVVVNIKGEILFLFRKFANTILLDKVGSNNNNKTIIKNIFKEYDVDIGREDQIYIIYQDEDMNLIMKILQEDKEEDIKLTREPIPEVIDLNLIVKGEKVHIIYLVKIQSEDRKYRIYHNYYDGDEWKSFMVEEVVAKKVLNPIKVLEKENKILLGYYINDTEIACKEFSYVKLNWGDPFKLVSGFSEKLYLDMIMDDKNIHLTYCEFQEGNLLIKYEKFSLQGDTYEKQLVGEISGRGSLSHPTIIIYEGVIWITWVEIDKVMSRFSRNNGETWSEYIYAWDDTRKIDFVRYKYLDTNGKENSILDYSFGSTYPEINFLGFGDLAKARKIEVKTKGKD